MPTCPECGTELMRPVARGKWFCPAPESVCTAFDLRKNKMGAFRIVSRSGFSFHKMSMGRSKE